MKKSPDVTLFIVFAVVFIHFYPGSFEALIYDHNKMMAGQWWRFFTGHLVHSSLEHMVRDSSSFLFLGTILEMRLGKAFLPLVLGTAFTISLGYLFITPPVLRYYGLSGINYGMCGYLLMQEIPRRYQEKQWFLFSFFTVMALMIIGKISYEYFTGGTFFYRTPNMTPAPEAHIMGNLWGMGFLLVRRILGKDHTIPPLPRSSLITALAGGAVYLGAVIFW